MRQMKTVVLYCMGFWIVLNSFQEAFAYLDPGSGSMILQLLLGGIAGAVMVLKLYWRRLVNLFKRGDARQENPSSSDLNQ